MDKYKIIDEISKDKVVEEIVYNIGDRGDEDLKDLVLKVDYYLRHEEERKAIAENGRKKAKESCSFISRLEKIFNQE